MASTRADLDGQLLALGKLALQVEGLEADLSGELDSVTQHYTAKLKPLRERRQQAEAALLKAFSDARGELLEGEGKTLKLGFGELSLRMGQARLDLAAGVSEAEAIARLREARSRRYLREKVTIDRNAVKKALDQGRLDESSLAALGRELIQGEETASVKLNHEALRAVVGLI